MTDLQTRPPVPTPSSRPQDGEHPGSPLGLVALAALVVLAGISGGWSLLAMIGAVIAMIFLHELGHYLTAKWAGMKVTEFFIGFGPRIWSFRKGETEYGVKAIPAGAYVKIIGMHNLDEYDPADQDRTYMSKPFWRRLSVAVAGSTMHFLLALGCLFSLFAFVGVPGGSITDPEWVVHERISPESPAAQAGVEAGDRILSVDGIAIGDFEHFTEVVRSRPGETVPVEIARDGETIALDVTLGDRHPQTDEQVGFFGVGDTVGPNERVGAVDAIGESFAGFGSVAAATIDGLTDLLSPSGLADLGSRVFETGDEPAVVDGGGGRPPTREEVEEDNGRAVSILGVVRIGSDLLENDFAVWLELFVLLNIFIGVFNLIPLLPLDGGHVAIAVYEKVRSMLRRGEPYHVDVVKLLPLTYAVVLVLVFIGVSTIYLDIADPIGG